MEERASESGSERAKVNGRSKVLRPPQCSTTHSSATLRHAQACGCGVGEQNLVGARGGVGGPMARRRRRRAPFNLLAASSKR
eukprot:149549-Rhodomonas_salina.1